MAQTQTAELEMEMKGTYPPAGLSGKATNTTALQMEFETGKAYMIESHPKRISTTAEYLGRAGETHVFKDPHFYIFLRERTITGTEERRIYCDLSHAGLDVLERDSVRRIPSAPEQERHERLTGILKKLKERI